MYKGRGIKKCSLPVWLLSWSTLVSGWSPGCPPSGFGERRVSSALSQLPQPTERRHLCKESWVLQWVTWPSKTKGLKSGLGGRADSLLLDLCWPECSMKTSRGWGDLAISFRPLTCSLLTSNVRISSVSLVLLYWFFYSLLEAKLSQWIHREKEVILLNYRQMVLWEEIWLS